MATTDGCAPGRHFRSAAVVTGLGVAALLAVLVGRGLGEAATELSMLELPLGMALVDTVVAVLILYRLPHNKVGGILAAAGGTAWLETVATSWSKGETFAWLSQWAWWPPIGLTVLALLVFPDGSLPSRRWRPLAALLLATTTVTAVALAVAAWRAPTPLLTGDEPWDAETARLMDLVRGLILLACAAMAGAAVAVGIRWRHAAGESRLQLTCALYGVVVLAGGLVLGALEVVGATLIGTVALPIAMTVAVLRYRLYELDVVLGRAFVRFVLAVLLVALLISLTRPADWGRTGREVFQHSLIAAAVLALLAEPVHRWVQREAARLLYGERQNPYQILGNLDQMLGRSVDPQSALLQVARTTTRALRIPYLAVEAFDDAGGEEGRLLAESGRLAGPTETFDMIVRGERIGRIVVGRRDPAEPLTVPDHDLLSQIALRAAGAVDAARLIRDLQDSRERLVLAREEERRRIRRDLHDGLGPTLFGLSMQVAALRRRNGGRADTGVMVDGIADDLQACAGEVRRVVDELRPATLDGGLPAALRAECRRYTTPGLKLRLEAPDRLDPLPAAVEVAVFRIVVEALTNVRRHARARNCRIRIHAGRALEVEIADDGVGIPGGHHEGVGLASIEERADELGGHCAISSVSPTGTSIKVWIPITPEEPSR